MGACGLASGAQAVYDALNEQLSAKAPGARLVRTGCMGFCYAEVMMEVERKGSSPAIYSGVTPDKVTMILDTYLGGDVGGAYALRSKTGAMRGEDGVPLLGELPFFKTRPRRSPASCTPRTR